MSIKVLNPTVTAGAGVTRAPRLGDFTGKTLGVLHNGRLGNAVVFEEIVRMLDSKYAFRDVIRRTKPRAFNIAPDEMLDELVSSCDVVITGLGD